MLFSRCGHEAGSHEAEGEAWAMLEAKVKAESLAFSGLETEFKAEALA